MSYRYDIEGVDRHRRLRTARRLPGPARALEMEPAEIIEAVKASGIRGRGGAGSRPG
jgi:NADH:ubiquinone oxidoreductase subunit F (NADH-binding)